MSEEKKGKLDPTSFRKKKDSRNADAAADAFISGAKENQTTEHDPKAKRTRTFTVPMNDYEIDLLRFVAEANDRSMRQESTRALVKALEAAKDEILENGN